MFGVAVSNVSADTIMLNGADMSFTHMTIGETANGVRPPTPDWSAPIALPLWYSLDGSSWTRLWNSGAVPNFGPLGNIAGDTLWLGAGGQGGTSPLQTSGGLSQISPTQINIEWDYFYKELTSPAGYVVEIRNMVTTLTVDGSGTINVDPVPIPAAAWLLGSGLVGMLGLCRKLNT
jgi:hypothetical protein